MRKSKSFKFTLRSDTDEQVIYLGECSMETTAVPT